ncbi:hypothetical protein FHS39_002548 [Streptomyces olivoverticillatus]|uniref:Uncharacterized protein n=1 Tax=Streptomyces olivoverticillatus TaxID=66427 RepID=A0A7W7LNW3_9ACTN|nr:hypothetical protein [Streptomyces olivoverticillatus]MBB4893517.1 hypothetical protein [Streptomyces olivoverticillatus]
MHTDIARVVNEWKPTTITMANGSERLITHQIIRRFAEKVEVSTDGCWRWTAGLVPTGYGSFKAKGLETYRAYRERKKANRDA